MTGVPGDRFNDLFAARIPKHDMGRLIFVPSADPGVSHKCAVARDGQCPDLRARRLHLIDLFVRGEIVQSQRPVIAAADRVPVFVRLVGIEWKRDALKG